ncbi:MAG: hypothetical protein ABIQ47_10680 [Tepidiformaceae bacterium]
MGITVQELIERLQECDPDAEVRIVSQESWPFENAISGVAVREDFAGEDCDCDHRFSEPHEEGARERYGDKNACLAARR